MRGREAAVSGPRGFTLLEVLVAFVIAALAVAALLHAGAAGLNASHEAARYEEAIARAQSHLAAAAHGGHLAPSDNQGEDGDGFAWRVRVSPAQSTRLRPAGPGPATELAVTLYAVSVWISWNDSGTARSVRLDTEQIGDTGQ